MTTTKFKMKIQKIAEKKTGPWTVLFGLSEDGFYTILCSAPGKKTQVMGFRPTRKDDAFGYYADITEKDLDAL